MPKYANRIVTMELNDGACPRWLPRWVAFAGWLEYEVWMAEYADKFEPTVSKKPGLGLV